MTYREMAMDAGCTTEEEINEMASYLEWEEEQYWLQKQQEEWEWEQRRWEEENERSE